MKMYGPGSLTRAAAAATLPSLAAVPHGFTGFSRLRARRAGVFQAELSQTPHWLHGVIRAHSPRNGGRPVSRMV